LTDLSEWRRNHPKATFREIGIDPILGGTQTWKLGHWSFIKADENNGEEVSIRIYNIPYK
jgi:hypothetical protein